MNAEFDWKEFSKEKLPYRPSDEYMKRVAFVSRRQIAIAGHRLAFILHSIFRRRSVLSLESPSLPASPAPSLVDRRRVAWRRVGVGSEELSERSADEQGRGASASTPQLCQKESPGILPLEERRGAFAAREASLEGRANAKDAIGTDWTEALMLCSAFALGFVCCLCHSFLCKNVATAGLAVSRPTTVVLPVASAEASSQTPLLQPAHPDANGDLSRLNQTPEEIDATTAQAIQAPADAPCAAR